MTISIEYNKNIQIHRICNNTIGGNPHTTRNQFIHSIVTSCRFDTNFGRGVQSNHAGRTDHQSKCPLVDLKLPVADWLEICFDFLQAWN